MAFSNFYLINFLPPSVDSFKRPLVRDVVDQEDSLRPSRVGSDDCAEATLAGSVPQLKFDSLPIDQDDGFLERCNEMRNGSRGEAQ